jgi:hypothetical protein
MVFRRNGIANAAGVVLGCRHSPARRALRILIEALTTTHSVWLCIPLLALSGVFTGPAIIALLALLGLYDLAIEVNGHRMEFPKWGRH